MTDSEQKRYTLEDLEVHEVSVVDRGANKRKLLVIKNAEDSMLDSTPAPTHDPVVAAQAEKAKETTDLIVGLSDETKAAVGGMLDNLSKRIDALSEAVKAAPTGEGGVSDKFKSEVAGLSVALRQLGVSEPTELADVAKALPPMSVPLTAGYGYSGMTMADVANAAPEYVMTAEGPMMKMPMEAMKGMACKYAMDELYKAEDELYKGDLMKACVCIYVCLKALGPFVPDDGGMPQQMAYAMKMLMEPKMAEAFKQYAFNQPQASIPAGVPNSHFPVNSEKPGSGTSEGHLAKAGRKLSQSRLDKLTDITAQLQALLAEAAPATAGEKDAVAKLADLTALAKAQAVKIQQLQSARPSGNVITPEGETAPHSNPVVWPDDLNDLPDQK